MNLIVLKFVRYEMNTNKGLGVCHQAPVSIKITEILTALSIGHHELIALKWKVRIDSWDFM